MTSPWACPVAPATYTRDMDGSESMDARGGAGTADGPDLYQVLGVDAGADAAELTHAFRRRLRELHPDTRQDPDEDRDGLEAVMIAYRTLRDPEHRARYDRERAAAARSVRRGVPIPVVVRRSLAEDPRYLVRVGPVRVRPLPPAR